MIKNLPSPINASFVRTVETEAPVNLTYELADAGGDEMGHSALLSWKYPTPADLQYGWITLVHQLQYRRVDEPDNWKVQNTFRFTVQNVSSEILDLVISRRDVSVVFSWLLYGKKL